MNPNQVDLGLGVESKAENGTSDDVIILSHRDKTF